MRNLNTLFLSAFFLLCALQSSAQFVQERSISDDESGVANQMMQLAVFDDRSNAPLPATVRVRGLNPRKTVDFENIVDTTFTIKTYRLYSVTCIKPGYMYYAEKFWPEEKAVHTQEVRLKPLATGLKTDIRDIVFLGDKTEIYHKSKPALDELIEFLNLNKTMRIAVIGHVNGPDNDRAERVYRKASLERAQAVVDYLVAAGIAAERLEAVGNGNQEMIYADPQTEWQNEANRRIEIEILSL